MDRVKYKQYSGYIRFVLKAAFENYKDASRFYSENVSMSAYDYYRDLLNRISIKTGFTPVQIIDIANLTDENLNTIEVYNPVNRG